MVVSRTWTWIVTLVSVAAAVHLPVERQTNDGVHLTITPVCGKLGGTFANANAAVPTTGIKTLVAFGDSYTSGGRSDGGILPAAVLNGTSPRAGGRAKGVACNLSTTIKDYTVHSFFPYKASIEITLFQVSAALFLSQKNVLDPAPALYTVFFGIKYATAILFRLKILIHLVDPDENHLPQAAAEHLAQIKQLAAAPTLAKNIVVLDDYGRGGHSATGDVWKQAVFAGLNPLRAQGLNVAFVDFAPLWEAVLGTTPGFAAFGYKTSGACIPNLSQTDLSGECVTRLNSFYWLPGHPSKETHRIMADYVKLALANCKA
ncbi:hypothetical protein DFH08DRAFT_822402 [Mycena albidolilacea]|uniref:Uncharacterized protein n=1 Tax=Mycena albidolilacea TaxID=1033008 RepID=A0AAD6Z810_9AGAR|nr:hypothetical protein DFH08DRAFT_822402 [Mycena albidolilacea]